MMASSLQTSPLQEALQVFGEQLHSKVPLELAHCSQFSPEAVIIKVAEEVKTSVWKELYEKLGDLAKTRQVSVDEQISIVTQFAPGIQFLTDECLRKHMGYKADAERLMEERIHQLRDNFSSSMREKLLLHKEMDVKTLAKYLEDGKSLALSYFVNWKHGNRVFYNDQEKLLKQELDILGNELLKKQVQNLEESVPMKTPEDKMQHNQTGHESNVTNDYAGTLEAPETIELNSVPVFMETLSKNGTDEPSSSSLSNQPTPHLGMITDKKANADAKLTTDDGSQGEQSLIRQSVSSNLIISNVVGNHDVERLAVAENPQFTEDCGNDKIIQRTEECRSADAGNSAGSNGGQITNISESESSNAELSTPASESLTSLIPVETIRTRDDNFIDELLQMELTSDNLGEISVENDEESLNLVEMGIYMSVNPGTEKILKCETDVGIVDVQHKRFRIKPEPVVVKVVKIRQPNPSTTEHSLVTANKITEDDDTEECQMQGSVSDAVAIAGSPPQSESEGFSDEGNVTVVAAEARTSDRNNQYRLRSSEIRGLKEQETHAMRSNRDAQNIPQSQREMRKRRRSQNENTIARACNSVTAPKRRRMLKETSMTPENSPSVTTTGKTKMSEKSVATNSSEGNNDVKSQRSKQTSMFTKNVVTKQKVGRQKFDVPSAIVVEAGFQCPETACKKILTYRSNYISHHIRQHQLKDVVYECQDPNCCCVFSHERDLKSHQLVHTNPEPFTCQKCGKILTTISNKRKHVIICRQKIAAEDVDE